MIADSKVGSVDLLVEFIEMGMADHYSLVDSLAGNGPFSYIALVLLGCLTLWH